jgi:hypothetical protein
VKWLNCERSWAREVGRLPQGHVDSCGVGQLRVHGVNWLAWVLAGLSRSVDWLAGPGDGPMAPSP